jgi:hypothetical protein
MVIVGGSRPRQVLEMVRVLGLERGGRYFLKRIERREDTA